jgi:hypothetical protein
MLDQPVPACEGHAQRFTVAPTPTREVGLPWAVAWKVTSYPCQPFPGRVGYSPPPEPSAGSGSLAARRNLPERRKYAEPRHPSGVSACKFRRFFTIARGPDCACLLAPYSATLATRDLSQKKKER